jgi:hypothetical protein
VAAFPSHNWVDVRREPIRVQRTNDRSRPKTLIAGGSLKELATRSRRTLSGACLLPSVLGETSHIVEW